MLNKILKWSWVQNMIVNAFIKLLKAEFIKVKAKDPGIGDVVNGMYQKPISIFLTDSLNKLEPGVASLTPIQLVKKRIAPLRDDVEGVIVKMIDGISEV